MAEMTIEQKRALALAAARLRAKQKQSPAPEKPSFLPGAITAFGQGASLGFSDEMAGAFQSMLPYPYGTKGAGGYDAAVQGVRDQQAAFSKEYPKTDMAMNILGGVTSSIPAAAAMPTFGASAAIPKWLQYAGASGGAGALSGYGYANEGEELQGAAVGGGLGALMGVAAPPIARAGGRALGLFRDAGMSMMSPEKQAAYKLTQAMQRDGLSPDQIAARLKELGPDAVLADAGGENILGLAEAAATAPGSSKDSILKFLKDRMRGQGERLNKAIMDYVSDAPGTVATINSLDASRKSAVAPLYQKAYSQIIPESDDLNAILQKNIVKRAYQDAIKIASDEGDDFVKSMTVKNGKITFKDNPTFKTLDYLKRGLDDIIDKETSDFGKLSPEGRRALIVKNELLSLLDSASPEYAAARKIYSDSAANQRALMVGRKFFREDYDVLEDVIADMSKTEKDFFKMGVARAMLDKTDNTAMGADRTRIFDRASVNKKLESVFDSKAEMDQFVSMLEKEQRKALTYSTVSGNSRTASRMASLDDMLNPRSIAKEVLGINDVPQMTNDQIGQMLLSKDPQQAAKALRYMSKLKTGPVMLPGLFARSAAIASPAGLMSQQNGN